MTNRKATYHFRLLLTGTLIWELIFWIFTFLLLFISGYLDNSVLGEQLSFKHPKAFWLLLFLIPVIGVFLWDIIRYNQLVVKINANTQLAVVRPVSSLRRFMKFFLFRNAFVLLIFALAQPVFGTQKVSGTMQNLEMVIALDVSNSMNTKDINPNMSRLDITKRALNELLNHLHGERIGICVFAGNAYVQLPVTTDYSAAKLFINEISTDMISNQGTNINAALATSVDMFSPIKSGKTILLVTDGENHESKPDSIIQEMKEKNISLGILGIGTLKGGAVPINPNRPELGYKRMPDGSPVISKVNPAFIKQLAAKTDGYATLQTGEFPDLSGLLTQINQIKRTKVEDLEFNIKDNRYQIPLFASMLFWLAFILYKTKRKTDLE